MAGGVVGERALTGAQDVRCVAGSLFVVSEAIKQMGKVSY